VRLGEDALRYTVRYEKCSGGDVNKDTDDTDDMGDNGDADNDSSDAQAAQPSVRRV
jgi:hypothetical protein